MQIKKAKKMKADTTKSWLFG